MEEDTKHKVLLYHINNIHNTLIHIGWPFAFSQSAFISNPIMYDIDNDGVSEVVVTTENAEVVFIR